MFRLKVEEKSVPRGTPFTKLTRGIWRYVDDKDCYVVVMCDDVKIYVTDGCIESVNLESWDEKDYFEKVNGTLTIRYE